VVQPRLSEDQDSTKISTGMVRFRWSSVEKRVKVFVPLLDLSTPFPHFGGWGRQTGGFSVQKAELAHLCLRQEIKPRGAIDFQAGSG
jgi:hypothetical protein